MVVGIPQAERVEAGCLLIGRSPTAYLLVFPAFLLFSFAVLSTILPVIFSTFSSFLIRQIFFLVFTALFLSFSPASFYSPRSLHAGLHNISNRKHEKSSRYCQMYFKRIPDQCLEMHQDHFLHLCRFMAIVIHHYWTP